MCRGTTCLNALWYADDVILLQYNGKDLQRSVHKLNQISRQQYNLNISDTKTKGNEIITNLDKV